MSALMFALALLAPTDQAQPASGEQAIVVTAPTPKVVHRRASEFAHDVTELSRDQVARFHYGICPRVMGLEPASAKVVRDRIIENARGVGAEVDRNPKCIVNFLVIVDENGGELVRYLARHKPSYVRGISPYEVSRIIRGPALARAWSVTSIANEDGGSRLSPDWDETYTMLIKNASIIALPTRVEIDGSVIVIDRAGAVGATLAQIADYASMRGLARTRPPAEPVVRSILTLFEPGAAREPELTRSDIIYLQTLYRSKGTETTNDQHGRFTEALSDDMLRRRAE